MEMELQEQERDGALVLALAGQVDSAAAPALAGRLEEAVNAPASRIVLDLERLEYIGSAGFRALLVAAKHSSAAGGRIVVCGLSERMRQLFEIAGFLELFPVARDRAAAIALAR
jgi:anti-anti-sigma factor